MPQELEYYRFNKSHSASEPQEEVKSENANGNGTDAADIVKTENGAAA